MCTAKHFANLLGFHSVSHSCNSLCYSDLWLYFLAQVEACRLTKTHCSRGGGKALPKGIIVETSDLHMRSLGFEEKDKVTRLTVHALVIVRQFRVATRVGAIVFLFGVTFYLNINDKLWR